MFDIVSILLIFFSFFGNNTQDKDNEFLDNTNTGLLAHNLIPNISNNNNQSGSQPHNSLFFMQQNHNKTNGFMSNSIEKKDETSIKKI